MLTLQNCDPQSLVAEVPAAADLFKKASDILGYDLLKVCVEGPKEKLDTTAVSCPVDDAEHRGSRRAFSSEKAIYTASDPGGQCALGPT